MLKPEKDKAQKTVMAPYCKQNKIKVLQCLSVCSHYDIKPIGAMIFICSFIFVS